MRCSIAAPGSARNPVNPSRTASRWPGIGLATAGVAHAAASVMVSPQPSKAEVEASTHARWYRSMSCSWLTRPGRRNHDPAPLARISRSSSSRADPSPAMTASRRGWRWRSLTSVAMS